MTRYRAIESLNYKEESGDIMTPEYIYSITLEPIKNKISEYIVKIENNETEEVAKELGIEDNNWIAEDYWAGAYDTLKGLKEWINSAEW